jgi:hypothetical protein
MTALPPTRILAQLLDAIEVRRRQRLFRERAAKRTQSNFRRLVLSMSGYNSLEFSYHAKLCRDAQNEQNDKQNENNNENDDQKDANLWLECGQRSCDSGAELALRGANLLSDDVSLLCVVLREPFARTFTSSFDALRRLDLTGNTLLNRTAIPSLSALVGRLDNCGPALESLLIGGCQLGDSAVTQLVVGGLQSPLSTVVNFEVWGNDVALHATSALLDLIGGGGGGDGAPLQRLDVSFNEYCASVVVFNAFARAIDGNWRMRELVVASWPACHIAERRIRSTLARNRRNAERRRASLRQLAWIAMHRLHDVVTSLRALPVEVALHCAKLFGDRPTSLSDDIEHEPVDSQLRALIAADDDGDELEDDETIESLRLRLSEAHRRIEQLVANQSSSSSSSPTQATKKRRRK